MNLPFCDECKKPLAEAKEIIAVSEIVFCEDKGQPRGQRGLHFCDKDCLRSWVVKNANRPNIVSLANP